MTEYDYSPAAMQAHMHKLASIDQWRQNNSKFPPVNPFTPTAREDTDFYASKKGKSKSKKSKHQKTYYSEGEDSDDSDYAGPDRPPTPPASAPVGFGYAAPFAPIGHPIPYPGIPPNSAPVRYSQQPPPPYQFINSQTGQPLVPVWNGSCWIYQQQSAVSPGTIVPSGSGRTHRNSSSRKHHKRQRSVPPPLPLPMVPGSSMSPMYMSPMRSGGYFQPQPQQHQTFSAMGRGPYSASLPAVSSAALYLNSGHTSPASGVYSLPQQNGYVQMPVPQAPMVPNSAGMRPSSASVMSYPYTGKATVIVESKRDHDREKGSSSFFGRLKKK